MTATTTDPRAQIIAFGNAFDYDTSAQLALHDAAPDAYTHFANARMMIQYRNELPLDAHYVARIAMMQADDCGACAQLNLRMAVQAGVDRSILAALIDDPDQLPAHLRDIREHAQDVAGGLPLDAERTSRIRERYGDAGFAELALNLTGCRIFPTLKRAMNMFSACEKLTLDFAR